MPSSPWSISVKTVGGRRFQRDGNADAASVGTTTSRIRGEDDVNVNDDDAYPSSSPSSSSSSHPTVTIDPISGNFTIAISPDDTLRSLRDVISKITGLGHGEMRLIYRGRIIADDRGNADEDEDDDDDDARDRRVRAAVRVRDVSGLCDGQTVHLVPRVVTATAPPAPISADAPSSTSTSPSSSSLLDRLLMSPTTTVASDGGGESNTTVASLSGEAGLALLAALLGASSSSSSSSSSSTADAGSRTSSSSAYSPSGIWGMVGRSPPPGGTTTTTTSTVGSGGGVSGPSMMVGGGPSSSSLPRGTAIGTAGGSGSAPPRRGGILGRSVDDAWGRNRDAPPIVREYVEVDDDEDYDYDDDDDDREDDDMDDDSDLLAVAASRAARRRRRRRRRSSYEPPLPPAFVPSPAPPPAVNAASSSSNVVPPPPTQPTPIAASASARARARARAQAARLTEADVRLPDPGGIEHVRQGMMTLHTMLGGEEGEGKNDDDDCDVDGPRAGRARRRRGSSQSRAYPRRKWYKGQWLDALDTVHQWLEATIVDVALPSDVLSEYYEDDREGEKTRTNTKDDDDVAKRRGGGGAPNDRYGRRRTACRSQPDAVVSANDLEGRRRLLLEPISQDESENDEDDDYDSYDDDRVRLPRDDDEGCRYRPRSDNDDVQLLLIHYNGWPHRWDEWIRGDSERIRPFRTRTRHRVNAGSSLSSSMSASSEWGGVNGGGGGRNQLACLTPQSAFSASPSTAIKDAEDAPSERAAMLVELARIMRSVNDLLQVSAAAAAVTGEIGNDQAPPTISDDSSSGSGGPSGLSQLPWRSVRNLPTPSQSLPVTDPNRNEDARGAPQSVAAESSPMSSFDSPTLDGARLRQLAPLLDRLGRTLTDAAPHIVALAESLPSLTMPSNSRSSVSHENRGRNAPSNCCGGVTAGDADATVAALSSSSEEEVDAIQSLTARASSLYFGVEDNDNEEENNDPIGNRVATAVPASPSSTATLGDVLEIVPEETMPRIDPDLTDYVNGMVNTTRGGGGGFVSGRNSIRDNGLDSLGSSLLASYLASIGGTSGVGGGILGENGENATDRDNARVIRMGGGRGGNGGPSALEVGGSGIDIHIHAIVTGPTMAGIGGLGGFLVDNAGGFGDGAAAIDTPRNNSRPFFGQASTPRNNSHDDDDADLFSELYSESPDPVNMHGEEDTHVNINEMSVNDIDHLLDECRGIEDDGEDRRDIENENIANIQQSFNTLNVNNSGNNDGSIIDASIKSLSEIESQESNPILPSPSSPSSPSDITASTRIGSIGRNSTSSSLGSRFFRRTFGRLSGSSSRRSSQ